MPDTSPTAAQVWEGDVTFFSIDTDLLQAAGFNFTQGALHLLPRQLPASMGLQLTELVVEEVVNHRMRSVNEAIQQFKGASDKLKRLVSIELTQIDQSFAELDVATTATTQFRTQVHEYATRCRGGVLPIAGADAAAELFKNYFAEKPPFAGRRDKKFEFPDAMSLWLLERFARDNNTMGVIASQDEGWRQYASTSEHLYWVKSIDELAMLFAATSDHARAIKEKIAAAVNDPKSALCAQLENALNRHAADSEWDASEIYNSSRRIEVEVYDANVAEYTISDDFNIWPSEGDPTTWVIELTTSLKVNVHVSVEFFVWDSIDREEFSMGTEGVLVQDEIEAEAFLTCSNVRLDSAPDDWEIEIEIANSSYSLQGFEVDMDFGDE